MTDVIKRQGSRKSEAFDHTKLHSSVQAACLSVRSPEGEAHMTANKVVDVVEKWASQKPSVTSEDLRRIATNALQIFHPEAAYLYQNHQLVV